MKELALILALPLLVAATQRHPRPQPTQEVLAEDSAITRETVHVVTPGETLGGIAARAKVPRVLIAEANRLKPPYRLYTGQRLTIPRTRHHTVAKGETGFGIALRYGVPWAAIRVANGIARGDTVRTGQDLLIPTIIAAPPTETAEIAAPDEGALSSATSQFGWPLSGEVLRGYASRRTPNFHDGIDIAVPLGTAVHAAATGRVVFAGPEPRQFGRLVVIDHGKGWHSAYGHLSAMSVKVGAKVARGAVIARSGQSGLARNPRLHFELRRANRPVDPAPRLGLQPSAQNAEPIARKAASQ